jgi:hypothetical protein
MMEFPHESVAVSHFFLCIPCDRPLHGIDPGLAVITVYDPASVSFGLGADQL